MSRASKIYGAARAPKPDEDNTQGYPGFARPIEDRYLQCLLTNTLGDTFYASQKDLVDQSEKVHLEAMQWDPEFVAKALVYARNEGFMRTQPIYGLALLTRAFPVGWTKDSLFEKIFPLVIRTPNDLMDFATIVKNISGGEGGRRIKRTAGNWLRDNINEYWAIKYGAKKDGGYSLRDLFRAYHPKWEENSADALRADLIDYILGKKWTPALLRKVAAFETLKVVGDSSAEKAIDCIEEGRLPHEVTTPFAGKNPAIWTAIAQQMPIFALLRNLATIERQGVMPALREKICRTFSDKNIVLKSKIFPYRFLDAMEKVSDQKIRDALRDAVEIAMDNIPHIDGTTAILIDRSGSMSGQYLRNAAIFGIALAKKSRDARVFAFDDRLEECHVSLRDSILTQASQLTARGGTDSALPVEYLLQEKHFVDNIILIGDEQQNVGTPFFEAVQKYRHKVSPDCKVFMVNVAPYTGGGLMPAKNAFYMFGWSDRILQFISMATIGFDSMAKAIAKLQLEADYGMGETASSEE